MTETPSLVTVGAPKDFWMITLRPRGPTQARPADIVGPVCESGDYLGKGRYLPPLEVGDLVAVMGAGAYGAVMASTYNSRPLAPEVLVAGARHHVIRPRLSYAELLARDSVPLWLTDQTVDHGA